MGAAALAASLLVVSVDHVAAYETNALGGGTREETGRAIGCLVGGGERVGFLGRLAPFQTPAVELGRCRWVDLSRDAGATPGWVLTAGEVRPPPGYVPAHASRPFGIPGFGRPERMSFASPAFTLWRREAGRWPR